MASQRLPTAPPLAASSIPGPVKVENCAREAAPGSGLMSEGFESSRVKRCLCLLMDSELGDSSRIAWALSVRHGLEDPAEASAVFSTVSGYAYAAKHWAQHLAQIRKPEGDVVALAAQFLNSLQFIFWSEYICSDFGNLHPIRAALTLLVNWAESLAEDDRNDLRLHVYYEAPYQRLLLQYEASKKDDGVLPWLVRKALGFFYYDMGRVRDMESVRTEVARGLNKLLGDQHPLALTAQSEDAYARLLQGRLREAHEVWMTVAGIQKRVVPGKGRRELYRTQFYKGMAEYLMNDHAAASTTLNGVLASFKADGPESNPYLTTKLWCALVDEAQGKLEQAAKAMEDIRETRSKSGDDAATLINTFLGNVYRRLGKEKESITALKSAVDQRKRLWPVTHQLVIDATIALAITYSDFDLQDEARALIDELEKSGRLEDGDKFYELCQTRHLKALLLFRQGSVGGAIEVLQKLVNDAKPDQEIQQLHWVRLDLADMLRHRDTLGDKDNARKLFDGVIVAKTSKGDVETESQTSADHRDVPAPPALAEEALRLARSGKVVEAQEFLDKNQFRWSCESSLWRVAGMPAADTMSMKPPTMLVGIDC